MERMTGRDGGKDMTVDVQEGVTYSVYIICSSASSSASASSSSLAFHPAFYPSCTTLDSALTERREHS